MGFFDKKNFFEKKNLKKHAKVSNSQFFNIKSPLDNQYSDGHQSTLISLNTHAFSCSPVNFDLPVTPNRRW